MDRPRLIDPALTFTKIVDWIYNEIVTWQRAPGLITGLSGTDSIVAFLAAADAFARISKQHRVWGVHFAPSEDFLYEHPEAEAHEWFRNVVVPWLRKRAPGAKIEVDTSIDWRQDGLRWGALGEMGAVSYQPKRRMREHDDRYWLMGTRNLTEEKLFTYSNASRACSIQPLVHLWKSEVLQVARHLGVPQIALDKSCDVDCICGRERLAAHHIREIDLILMARAGELSWQYVTENIPADVGVQLDAYIDKQIQRSDYKRFIPCTPRYSLAVEAPLVEEFENGTLNLHDFDHWQHLYIAWCYLTSMTYVDALKRYCHFLKKILEAAGVNKFSEEITESYFYKLDMAMRQHPGTGFDELMDRAGGSLT